MQTAVNKALMGVRQHLKTHLSVLDISDFFARLNLLVFPLLRIIISLKEKKSIVKDEGATGVKPKRNCY